MHPAEVVHLGRRDLKPCLDLPGATPAGLCSTWSVLADTHVLRRVLTDSRDSQDHKQNCLSGVSEHILRGLTKPA